MRFKRPKFKRVVVVGLSSTFVLVAMLCTRSFFADDLLLQMRRDPYPDGVHRSWRFVGIDSAQGWVSLRRDFDLNDNPRSYSMPEHPGPFPDGWSFDSAAPNPNSMSVSRLWDLHSGKVSGPSSEEEVSRFIVPGIAIWSHETYWRQTSNISVHCAWLLFATGRYPLIRFWPRRR